MAFTSQDVMALRQRTGVGMMDCKKALAETDGDMEKAIVYLREKGIATAAKKSGRIASEGIVCSKISGKTAVLLEVNCESDFVAQSPTFRAFADEIAAYILENDVKGAEEVAELKADSLTEAIARIGEKISIRRFEKIQTENGVLSDYIHLGGKIGVLVEASEGANPDVIHDVALQIAAAKPSFIAVEDVPASVIESEKNILKAQALNEENPKPIAIIERMIEGRIKKFYKDVCLLEQEFVKNTEFTIARYLKENGGAKILRFTRFEMGEGLEKKENNFAQEIMQQVEAMKK
jgi:elongation factor Ts